MGLPSLRLQLTDAPGMSLEIPQLWLDDHPLTEADLEQEVEIQAAVDHELQIIKT